MSFINKGKIALLKIKLTKQRQYRAIFDEISDTKDIAIMDHNDGIKDVNGDRVFGLLVLPSKGLNDGLAGAVRKIELAKFLKEIYGVDVFCANKDAHNIIIYTKYENFKKISTREALIKECESHIASEIESTQLEIARLS